MLIYKAPCAVHLKDGMGRFAALQQRLPPVPEENETMGGDTTALQRSGRVLVRLVDLAAPAGEPPLRMLREILLRHAFRIHQAFPLGQRTLKHLPALHA